VLGGGSSAFGSISKAKAAEFAANFERHGLAPALTEGWTGHQAQFVNASFARAMTGKFDDALRMLRAAGLPDEEFESLAGKLRETHMEAVEARVMEMRLARTGALEGNDPAFVREEALIEGTTELVNLPNGHHFRRLRDGRCYVCSSDCIHVQELADEFGDLLKAEKYKLQLAKLGELSNAGKTESALKLKRYLHERMSLEKANHLDSIMRNLISSQGHAAGVGIGSWERVSKYLVDDLASLRRLMDQPDAAILRKLKELDGHMEKVKYFLRIGKLSEMSTEMTQVRRLIGDDPAIRFKRDIFIDNGLALSRSDIAAYAGQLIRRKGGRYGLTTTDWESLAHYFHGSDASFQSFIKRSEKDMLYGFTLARDEMEDGGHALSRHGPDVDDVRLEVRARTGTAPDGLHSPTSISTKFKSYQEFFQTRNKALAAIQKGKSDKGVRVNLKVGPGVGGNSPSHQMYFAIIEHPNLSDPTTGFATHGIGLSVPSGGTAPIGPGMNRTATRVRWDSVKQRWKIVQHIPWGRDFDYSTLTYVTPPHG
jgi:hypothetical protein